MHAKCVTIVNSGLPCIPSSLLSKALRQKPTYSQQAPLEKPSKDLNYQNTTVNHC